MPIRTTVPASLGHGIGTRTLLKVGKTSHFIGADATDGAAGSIAEFMTDPIQANVVGFWYVEYGADEGSLSISSRRAGVGAFEIKWTSSGDQGSGWKYTEVVVGAWTGSGSIPAYEITWTYERGASWISDIAIDDVQFMAVKTSAVTPTVVSNPGTLTVQIRKIQSNGPSRSAENSQWYLVADATDVLPSSYATTEFAAVDEANLLTFDYHMYGDDIRALRVDWKRLDSVAWCIVWFAHGEQAQGWQHAEVPLFASPAYIRITAIRGADYKGDIAIDNVRFYKEGDDRGNIKFYKTTVAKATDGELVDMAGSVRINI
ncbi:hypothetical protein T492DRAFT_833231 [Pavlovales sp. CCMP2436]|nr:hypothetical protein T492DRAFT_833231 [Pavlovales sp. CCMP2436]